VRTTVDLINLSPSRPLIGEIPNEVWYGKKAFYGHLRVLDLRALDAGHLSMFQKMKEES